MTRQATTAVKPGPSARILVACALKIRPLPVDCGGGLPGDALSGARISLRRGNAAVFGTAAGLATGNSAEPPRESIPELLYLPLLEQLRLAAGMSYVIARHQGPPNGIGRLLEQRARLYMAERAAAQQRASGTAAASSTQRAGRPNRLRADTLRSRHRASRTTRANRLS